MSLVSKSTAVLGVALCASVLLAADPLRIAWAVNASALAAVRASTRLTRAMPDNYTPDVSDNADVRERVLYFAGIVAQQRGDRSTAVLRLTEAQRLQPNDRLAQFAAGSIVEAEGDHALALRYWQAANAADHFSVLGEHQLKAGDRSAARYSYAIAADIHPGVATFLDLGFSAAAASDWTAAITAYTRASDYGPTQPEPLIRIAAILQDDLSQPADAVPLLERAVQLAPTYSVWPYIRIGNYYRDTGDPESATLWYERARGAFPGDPEPAVRLSALNGR